jgi:alpha-amylase
MQMNSTKFLVRLFFVLFLVTTTVNGLIAQRVKKVVVQAFWWDHWNNNFRFKWADYLTELAPRLKALGVDAIWIPPNYKNDGPGSVGYGPFDQYDLGDKNQKGELLSDTIRTRSGTKDELLRMIAVMHANGIEVIQDIVLNHTTGAGNRGGGGGRDYTAASIPYNDATNGFGGTNFYKNFRYVSYGTPHLDTSAADYFTRSGRWSKNIMNFYPNANNTSVNTTDINKTYFGPDMAFENNSIGQSTNIPKTGTVTINGITKPYFNPVQPSNYMAQSAKDWIVWYKKQTGADGFRWDAVKHFGFDVQRDLTYALKYQSNFANGGNDMLNIGEWVGSSSEIDYYASQLIKAGTPAESNVPNEQMSAGFDFGLRGYSSSGGIYAMVMGGGGFNMQAVPGAQQSQTYRYFDYLGGKRVFKTVPFVNSHDTYRPILTANGNYSQALGNSAGWNTSNELGGNGQHIDPREPRFAAANAVISAVDGNPCFFLEDVFDYFSLNKRWSHLPADADSLPLRKDIGNIMQCHQKLNFKDGDYAVPTALTGASAPVYAVGSSGDHLVIERTGKAFIGISDAYSPASNNSADQQVWVTADNAWSVGTPLYDYSGAHGVTSTQIYNDRRVLISTAPCGHNIAGALGHGYSIWAPYPNGTPTSVTDLYNYIATYDQPRGRTTTQEWEMADDLGDSHCGSLGQGGQLPANSFNQRVAGKIYVQNGTNVAYKISPQIDNTHVCISLWDLDGNKLSEACGNSSAASPILGSYSTTYTGWITVKVRNEYNTQAAQKVWANVTYTAPTTLNTRDAVTSATTRASIWTGNKGTSDITDCGNWEEGKLPTQTSQIVIPNYALPRPLFSNTIAGRTITLTNTNGTYKNINNCVIKVSGDVSLTANSVTTGSYNFNNLNTGIYTIKPTKNNDIKKNNGISSIDVILVTNHILSKSKLNSPYKIIAADVNNNKTVTNIDVIFMKRLILGVDTNFVGNRLWTFVDSAYKFADSTNPFPYKDSIQINELTRSKFNQTFFGVKLGDVNYDWNASQARGIATKPLELITDELRIQNGELRIPISVKNFKDLTAFQYTLNFDNNNYEFVAIEHNKLGVELNDKQASRNGAISFLWADAKGEEQSLEDGKELFTLVLKSKWRTGNSDLEIKNMKLEISNDITDIEAWDKDNQQHHIILSQKEIPTSHSPLATSEIWTVSPNPNNGNIVASLYSNTNKTIVFELSNAVGKTLYTQTVEAVKGNNSFRLNLNKNATLAAGVYFIKTKGLEGDTVRKIVVKG